MMTWSSDSAVFLFRCRRIGGAWGMAFVGEQQVVGLIALCWSVPTRLAECTWPSRSSSSVIWRHAGWIRAASLRNCSAKLAHFPGVFSLFLAILFFPCTTHFPHPHFFIPFMCASSFMKLFVLTITPSLLHIEHWTPVPLNYSFFPPWRLSSSCFTTT